MTITKTSFQELLLRKFDSYRVAKKALKNPFTGDNSENFGLFLPQKGFKELPKTFKAGYTPHTIMDVCNTVAAAEAVMDFSNARMKVRWDNGHRISFQFGDTVEITPGDRVQPTFDLSCGYDGTSFKVVCGLFRMVCSNGLVVPVKDTKFCMTRLTHSANLHDKMPLLISEIEQTVKGISEMIGYAKNLSEKKVNFEQIYKKIYGERPETGRSATNWDNRKSGIEDIVVKESASLGKDSTEWYNGLTSAWLMVNAVQGYYQHKSSNTAKRTPFAARDWANSQPAVAAAWQAVAA